MAVIPDFRTEVERRRRNRILGAIPSAELARLAPALERVCCECYAIVRREFERLLEGRTSPSPLDGVRLSIAGLSIAGLSVAGDASGAFTDPRVAGIEPLH